MKKRVALVGAAALMCSATGAMGQTLGTTAPIATLLGPYGTSQMSIGLYGTDLGYAVGYGGSLRLLFGDSWADSNGTAINTVNGVSTADDCQGSISLISFPDGDSVDAWASSHAGTPAWRSAGPTLTMRTNLSGKVAYLPVYDSNTTVLDMSLGRTPIGAFANNASIGGGFFALFARQVPYMCTSATSCATGYTCDQNMGTCNGTAPENKPIPCVIGSLRCNCVKPTGYVGVCQDQTSSVYANTEDGRILSTVGRNRVGNADPLIPEVYYTQEMLTRKFLNPAVRSVRDFLPSRANGSGNVYTPGTGASGGNEKVFLWGRPDYAAYGHWTGKDAKLYFAYANMPTYSSNGSFAFSVNYFTGLGSTAGCTSGGTSGSYPCFSTDPSTALALDLSGGADPTYETLDVVDQMTISYVPSIGKFVMIYGGDVPDLFLALDVGPNWRQIVHNTDGAFYIRFASQPWGPWSAPQPILKAGPLNPPTSGFQYASNGALYDPYCTGTCAAMDSHYFFWSEGDKVGRFYAPTIVDEWTENRGTNTADLYWFASTWDPYEVITVKTRINP